MLLWLGSSLPRHYNTNNSMMSPVVRWAGTTKPSLSSSASASPTKLFDTPHPVSLLWPSTMTSFASLEHILNWLRTESERSKRVKSLHGPLTWKASSCFISEWSIVCHGKYCGITQTSWQNSHQSKRTGYSEGTCLNGENKRPHSFTRKRVVVIAEVQTTTKREISITQALAPLQVVLQNLRATDDTAVESTTSERIIPSLVSQYQVERLVLWI